MQTLSTLLTKNLALVVPFLPSKYLIIIYFSTFSADPNLTILKLNGNQFEEFPACIGQFVRLEHLYLTRNGQLRGLSDTISNLTNLKILNLSHTQLEELPNEIGQLIALDTLDLSHTQLEELPNEIGQLVALNTLNLSHTQLEELPNEIGQLVALNTLDLSHTA